MSKKLYAALLPVLAVAAFAVVPSIASAQEWHRCVTGSPHSAVCPAGQHLVTVGAKGAAVKVLTKGTLTLTDEQILPGPPPDPVVVVCHIVDDGIIWNEGGVGRDLIESFEEDPAFKPACTATVSGGACEKASFKAILPWESVLETVAGVTRDKISKIEVDITLTNCPEIGTATLPYTGSLTPRIVNGSATAATFAEFDQPGSGHLTSALGTEGKVTGNDTIEGEAAGERIRAE